VLEDEPCSKSRARETPGFARRCSTSPEREALLSPSAGAVVRCWKSRIERGLDW